MPLPRWRVRERVWMGDQLEAGWDEDDSALFLEMGALFTPRREEIAETLISLIPAASADPLHGVELGVGAGWLTEAVLRRFPNASMLGLDGSPAMLDAASERLAPFGERFTPGRFALEDSTWMDQLPSELQCILSSLTLHHLDDARKRSLYTHLRPRLAPGGALLIADIIAPTSEQARRTMAASWDADVRQQSIALMGDERAFERFQAEQWNIFTYPDPEVDKPSTLPDHLAWLAEAGFIGADVFWARSGHAVYGGFAP